MVSFDMRTIIFSFVLTYMVGTFVIFILWTQYHNRYKGTTWLVFNFALQTLGLLLLVLRGGIPEWASIILANTLLIGGIILGYIGLEAYTGKKTNQIHNILILVLFTLVHVWFTYFKPDLEARNLNISVTSLLLFLQYVWLMLFRVERERRALTRTIGLVFVAFCLVSLTNILSFIIGGKDMPADYFDSGPFDTVVTIVYHMLVILFTYSLVLMFSRNLLMDITAGNEINYLTTIEKISDRKMYDETIRHERNLLRTLIDNLPDPVSIKDSEGLYLLNNKSHLELIGADSQEETIGKSVFDFLPEDQAIISDEDDKNVFRTGKMILDKIEKSHHTETGFPCWHLTSKIPIFNENGTPIQLVTIRHDITERKRVEDSLIVSDEFNRSLLKTIPFGMNIVDEEGTILFMNEKFRKIFGPDAVGQKCWHLIRDNKEQCTDCPLMKGIIVGETEIYESQGIQGGRVFDIYHTGMMYYGKKAMLEIFHDITDHKTTEGELIKSKDRAEESDRLKTAFLHNVSHEIRTPMNAIVGFTTLLSEPGITPEEHRSYLDIITQSSNHLLSIVTDIIEISNVEAGKMKLNLTKTDIHTVFENLNFQFSPGAVSKGLEFICRMPQEDNTFYFYTDSTKLIQVLSNLLSNAVKFTSKGRIEFGCRRYNETIEFYVSDTGIGIPEDHKYKVFDRFYQVDSRESREHEGTGLGLSLSKAYIEFLGGKIWFNSEVGRGSTFFVTIPC
jgi:PAS domain S-box-containing protein